MWFATGAGWAQWGRETHVYMPNGQPTGVIEVRLESDDMTLRTTFYTDSKGKLIIPPGYAVGKPMTLTFPGDGKTYSTTIVRWTPPAMLPEVNLKRPEDAGAAAIVEEEVFKPLPKARQLHLDGLQLLQNNKRDAAETKFRKAIEADPNFSAPYNDLAALLLASRKYSEAEQVARQGLSKNPQSFRLNFNLGTALNYLRRYQDAKGPLRTALKAKPNWTNAATQLGIALLESDQAQAAQPCLEQGTRGEGLDQAFAYMYLGKLYAEQGNYAGAVYAWEQFLKLDSTSPNATRIKNVLEQIRPQVAKPVSEIRTTGNCD